MQELLFHVCVGVLAGRERREWRGIAGRVEEIERGEGAGGGGVEAGGGGSGGGTGKEKEPPHFSRIWRPQILAIILPHTTLQTQTLHPRLISFISHLRARSGLCILSSVVTPREIDDFARQQGHVFAGGREGERVFREMTEEVVFRRRLMLLKAMREEGITGFTKVFTSPSVRVGQSILLQTVGLGDLTPNTVILSWPDHPHPHASYPTETDAAVDEIWRLQELWFMTRRAGYSSIICKGLENFPSNQESRSGFLDVWWIVQEGQLQLLIAWILKQHHVWRGCQIRLFSIACASEDPVQVESELRLYLSVMRIPVAVVEVVTIDVLDPGMLGPVPVDPTPEEDLRRLMRSRESLLAQALKTDFEREASELGGGDGVDGVNGAHGIQSNGANAHNSTFIHTWLHTTSHLPTPHRRELFLKAHTVARLKREIDKRSSGEDVELVLMNLPVMDLCGGVGFGCGGGHGGGRKGKAGVSGDGDREWVEKGKLR
ncbi:hypothetical protein HDV00_012290, partial [Rhizophlyctis rosea]